MLISALAAEAETHRVSAIRLNNSFHHRREPVLRIQSGDLIVTRTIDASGRDETGKLVAEDPNPLTWPLHIEGGESGDSIAVRFRRLRRNRD